MFVKFTGDTKSEALRVQLVDKDALLFNNMRQNFLSSSTWYRIRSKDVFIQGKDGLRGVESC